MDIVGEKEQLKNYLIDLIQVANLEKNDVFVLGCSSSEIKGEEIGTSGDLHIALELLDVVLSVLSNRGIFLAVQCCEHLNRALIVEANCPLGQNSTQVNVVPTRTAGGAVATSAWKMFEKPIVVEFIQAKAGIDIGDTSIGMHIKHVQIPFRHSLKMFGKARLIGLYSRMKMIGGERAKYQ